MGQWRLLEQPQVTFGRLRGDNAYADSRTAARARDESLAWLRPALRSNASGNGTPIALLGLGLAKDFHRWNHGARALQLVTESESRTSELILLASPQALFALETDTTLGSVAQTQADPACISRDAATERSIPAPGPFRGSAIACLRGYKLPTVVALRSIRVLHPRGLIRR